jgi:hypothetical protein
VQSSALPCKLCPSPFICILFLNQGLDNLAQAGLELLSSRLCLPNSWDYRYEPPCSAHFLPCHATLAWGRDRPSLWCLLFPSSAGSLGGLTSPVKFHPQAVSLHYTSSFSFSPTTGHLCQLPTCPPHSAQRPILHPHHQPTPLMVIPSQGTVPASYWSQPAATFGSSL